MTETGPAGSLQFSPSIRACPPALPYVVVSVLDEDSLSEEEPVPLVLDQTWRGDPDSEADSIDSDHEDPLKWVLSPL